MNTVSRGLVCLCSLAGFALPCAASLNTFLFTVSNTISPEQPSATVRLRGAFDPMWFAFAKTADLQVAANPDGGVFSDPQVLLYQDVGSQPGNVSPQGDRVTDIVLIQLQWIFGHFADTANPLMLWSATWTADDFTPREVALWIESVEYYIYLDGTGASEDFYGTDFAEGSGVIHIVPAPAALLVLAGPLSARRRRGSAPARV